MIFYQILQMLKLFFKDEKINFDYGKNVTINSKIVSAKLGCKAGSWLSMTMLVSHTSALPWPIALRLIF